jgi:hypothetical protein
MWFKDSATVTDSVSITKSINPSCIRDELVPMLEAVNKTTDNGRLIVIYILLQVYIENHFHYYLDFLIGNSFSSANSVACWNAKDNIQKKISCFETVLQISGMNYSSNLLSSTVNKYAQIAAARNALAHGHPLTETTENGKVTKSRAKTYLLPSTLSETIDTANKMMADWNTLISELQPQKDAIKKAGLPQGDFLKNCKFTRMFEVKNL